jgi:hypothetical protein
MDPIRTTADPAHSPAELDGCGPGRTARTGKVAFEFHLLHHPHDQRITRLVLCVDLVGFRRICPARVGCVLGCAPEPEGACRIVWMIKRMISHDAMSPAEHLTAAAAQSDG